ncbi:hypothetical protein MASR2M66_25900 [Chloroflexota bacterium]
MDEMTNADEMGTDPTHKQIMKTACGGTLKDPTGYPSAIYNANRIYFCTHACLRAFEYDPSSFMAGEVEHPIRED